MAKDDRPQKMPTVKQHPRGDYPVGFAKTPEASRFKKGEPSRNPRGRPRKDKHVVAVDTLEILTQPVKIKVNGKTQIVPALEANLRSTIADAINGNVSAIKEAVDLMIIYGVLKREAFKPFVDEEASRRRLDLAYAALDAAEEKAVAEWEANNGC